MDPTLPLLAVGLALSFLTAVALGSNDAATPTDCAVGAGAISMNKALLLFAAFSGLGAVTQGYLVMETIGKRIVPEIDIIGAISVSLATITWVLLCSWFGLDVSVTHTTVGAVVGYGLLKYGLGGVNSSVITKVILSWIFSPVAGIVVAFALHKLLSWLLFRAGSKSLETFEKFTRVLLVGSLCFSAFSFGANDVANATGVYVTVAALVGRMPDRTAMFYLAILGAIGIAVGGFWLGRRVIETVAFRLTRLDVLSGLASELSNATVVYAFTWLGMPVSTSLVSDSGIVGAGLSRGRGSVNLYVFSKLGLAWVITVPASSVLAATFDLLLTALLNFL